MAITTIADMQIVPEKFTQYTIQRTTDKLALVNGGITTGNPTVAQIINGTPKGGNSILMPFFKPLEGEDKVFGEDTLGDADKVTTGVQRAALLIRQNYWGDTDLSYVFGGADPMAAIGNLVGDWWAQKEQAVILATLKGILDPTTGALKDHVNDISTESGEAAIISVEAALDTKQAMGDAAGKLGTVYMHSATYTKLQKNQDIATEYDATLQVNIQTYLGYRVVVDDSLPYTMYVDGTSGGSDIKVTTANKAEIMKHYRGSKSDLTPETDYVKKEDIIYDTYFLGSGVFIREYGTPAGLITTETDRDKISGENYLINRRAYVMHPNGISWKANALTDSGAKYAANVDLAKAANWELVVDHKNVPITMLRHKL